jgi:hypothetical protein
VSGQGVEQRVADARGHRVVFLSHCLLNQNVRYPGGASRPGGLQDEVDGYLRDGVGVVQLPCPEQHAWGGVRKALILPAYGSGGTVRAPLIRSLLPAFLVLTRWRYRRLARAAARDIASSQRAGCALLAVVGVDGSPSCGVARTLDMYGAVGALTRCPLAGLDRDRLNREVIAANVVPGQGMFVAALQRQVQRRGLRVPFVGHDLLAEPGISACRREPVRPGISRGPGPDAPAAIRRGPRPPR